MKELNRKGEGKTKKIKKVWEERYKEKERVEERKKARNKVKLKEWIEKQNIASKKKVKTR